MLTIEECLEFSELPNSTIEAIAEHEHIPDVVAAEVGFELLTHQEGLAEIQRMIDEDIDQAMATAHLVHALELQQAKEEFKRCCCQPER